MVLTFTFLVTVVLLVTTAVVSIAKLKNPDVDTDTATQSLFSLVSGILGALLGLIAGKAVAGKHFDVSPDDKPADEQEPTPDVGAK